MKPIESTFNAIMESSLFRLNGPEIDLPAALIDLGNAIADNETDDSTWSLGESLDCDLGSLIVGAYWALSNWHGGQSSDTYAALCALGRVYSPGMTSGPEPDSCEAYAFDVVSQWFETHATR